MSTSRMDFLKALTKPGRACRNSIVSRKADGVNTHQIRIKTTYGANTKKGRRFCVARACCCALKSMVLGLEVCLIKCTYGSNKSQHRDRKNLETTQSLNQAFGRCIDFQRCCPTMKVSIWANHGSNTFGVSNNLHLTELFAILRNPSPQRITFFGATLNPAAIPIVQIEASYLTHCLEGRSQSSHQTPKR